MGSETMRCVRMASDHDHFRRKSGAVLDATVYKREKAESDLATKVCANCRVAVQAETLELEQCVRIFKADGQRRETVLGV